MNGARFIRNDADLLVGKTFVSLVDFLRVPKGTRGTVVKVDHATGSNIFILVIDWELHEVQVYQNRSRGADALPIRNRATPAGGLAILGIAGKPTSTARDTSATFGSGSNTTTTRQHLSVCCAT